LEKVTTSHIKQEGTAMENTHEYVQKLHENQKKNEQNKKRQGKENPSDKLPNKQH
jgi:hypothetical protein